MDRSTEDTTSSSGRFSPQRKVLHWMIGVFVAWLFVYTVLQGQDGFFARTVDRVEPWWVRLVFLNIPLQILLTLVTTACARSPRPAVLNVGVWVGALNSVLVVVHIILSVATA